MAFALVSDEDGAELMQASDVDGFFVPPAAEAQAWRTFDLRGCLSPERGEVGNIELCVRDHAGRTIGAYFVANGTLENVRPSRMGDGLFDVSMTGLLLSQPDPMAGGIWQRWRFGPPNEQNLWATFDRAGRTGWLEVVRMYRQRDLHDRPAGETVVADGQFATDPPGMYLALGEAINGPGGYFGGDPDALADCLRDGFGATTPMTIRWKSAEIARLGTEPLFPGAETSHWDAMLAVLAKARVTVTLQ